MTKTFCRVGPWRRTASHRQQLDVLEASACRSLLRFVQASQARRHSCRQRRCNERSLEPKL